MQDLTYAGFVRALSHKRVLDFPWNKKYHVPYKRYPKNLGYSGIASFLPAIRKLDFKSFDLIILGSAKVDAFQNYLEVAHLFRADATVVFIDGGDQPKIGGDLAIYGEPCLFEAAQSVRPFDFIFKREFLVGVDYGQGVFPFPMCFDHQRRIVSSEAFKYDVTFWAVESDPIRSEAFRLLRGQFDCSENGTVDGQKFSRYARKGSWYLRELKRSKVALNFRGGGWDTLRYWEIPASGGPMMISQEPGIVIPSNYRNGIEVIFCKPDLSDLLDLATFYLKKDRLRDKIVANALKWSALNHTPEKRIEYFFKCLNVC